LPLIVTFHGQDITRLPKFTLYPPAWFNYWLHYKELQKEGTLFLGVSDFISRKMIEKGFPKERVRTHYLGVPVQPTLAKADNKDNIVLTVGRLVEKKGTEYLIRAMADVVRTVKDARLIICGDGPLRAYLEKLAQELRIENSVEFRGWQSKIELQEQFRKANIFVLPSVTAKDGDCEGLGMVFLEAMTYGVPVIGTDHGGIPDVIRHNETGFLIPEKDNNALAEKIKILLNDKALAVKMGERGFELVNEKFNIQKQIGKLENMYDELI
jgi:glycosyltransferase involved in cell wall biosynthesis